MTKLFLLTIFLTHACQCTHWVEHYYTGAYAPLSRAQGGAFISKSHGKTMYNFGGRRDCVDGTSACINQFFDDVQAYSFNDEVWFQPIQVGTVSPSPRSTFGYYGWKNQDSLLIYGGTTYNGTSEAPRSIHFFDELWKMKVVGTNQVQWIQLNSIGGPGLRAGSGIVVIDNTLYLFGGLLGTTFAAQNDMWSYNLITNQWTLLIPNNPAAQPKPRYLHYLVVNHGHILVSGGDSIPANADLLDDVWSFDPSTNTWTFITQGVQLNINGAAATLDNIFLFVFGEIRGEEGCEDSVTGFDSNPTDKCWMTTLDPALHPSFQLVKFDLGPGNLKMMNFVTDGNTLYIAFGFNFPCQDTDKGRFIFNSHVYSLDLGPLDK